MTSAVAITPEISQFFAVRKLRSSCKSHSLRHDKEINSRENERKKSLASANVKVVVVPLAPLYKTVHVDV